MARLSLRALLLGLMLASGSTSGFAQLDPDEASEPRLPRISRSPLEGKPAPNPFQMNEATDTEAGSAPIDVGAAGGAAPAVEPSPTVTEEPPSPTPGAAPPAGAPTAAAPALLAGTPAPSPSPSNLPPLSKAVENLRWEASLAENAYNLNKSEATTIPLLMAYERVVGPLCMPDLHKTLVYGGAPTDPRCIEYLEKIAAIEPENPIALCARDGIDAKSCRTAFAEQRVDVFYNQAEGMSMGAGSSGSELLENQLSVTTAAPRLGELETKIRSVEYQLSSNQTVSPDAKQALRANFEEALSLACRITRLRFDLLNPTEVGMNPQPFADIARAIPTQPPLFPSGGGKAEKKLSPMESVLKELGGESEPEPMRRNGIPRTRVRLIAANCKEYIDRALRIDRTMAMPVCYRDGFYSPTCVEARRRAKNAPRTDQASGASSAGSRPPPPSRGEGFSKF